MLGKIREFIFMKNEKANLQPQIFWVGDTLNDNYFSEVYSALLQRNLISGYMSHATNSECGQLEFIDSTLLYTLSGIDHAFPQLNWTYGSSLTIEKLSSIRSDVYFAIDRISPNVKTMHYKEMYFNKLAGYFIGFLEKVFIQRVVVQHTPHMPWDILFCQMAKLADIDVFSVNRVVPGCGVVWSGIGSEGQMIYLKNHKKEEGKINFKSAKKGFERKVESVKLVHYEKSRNDNRALKNFTKAVTPRFVKKHLFLFRHCLAGIPVQYRPATKNTTQCTVLAGEEFVQRKEFFFIIRKYMDHLGSLKSYMDKNGSVDPDLDAKYAYLPLHCQPERSTLPEGGIYRDQLVLASRLREVLPNDYFIYVKEHPKQFNWDLRNKNFRSTGFYDELQKIDKLRLIHHTYSSQKLVGSARLIATVTGTSAVEALFQGVPALVFGMSFLDGCDSVVRQKNDFQINSRSICGLLEKNTKDVITDFRRFLEKAPWYKICSSAEEWEKCGSKREYVDNLIEMLIARPDSSGFGAGKPKTLT